MLQINTKAPNFSLPNQDKKIISLNDFLGKKVLIYFYPKDDTPGCTKEACSLRDDFLGFEKINAVILGISADSPESHKNFVQKYNLPFNLLSDEKKDVIKNYGAFQKKVFFGMKKEGIKRISYLINEDGFIKKNYPSVNPFTHAKEVIQDVEN